MSSVTPIRTRPVTIAPLNNARVFEPFKWLEDNAHPLARYYSQVTPLSEEVMLNVIKWLLIRHEIEIFNATLPCLGGE